MTPDEHYAEAERLLLGVDGLSRTECAVLAQAHATLATINPDALWPRVWIVGNPPTCAACGHEHHIGPPDNRCLDIACPCPAPSFPIEEPLR